MEEHENDARKTALEADWRRTDAEVAMAFESGVVLSASRNTLERWITALCGRTYEFERDQKPMLQRLEVIKHLVVVRLAEESPKRRDDQAAASSLAMQRHNFWTRWIAVIGIIITTLAVIANWLKPTAQIHMPPPLAPGITTPSPGAALSPPAPPQPKRP